VRHLVVCWPTGLLGVEKKKGILGRGERGKNGRGGGGGQTKLWGGSVKFMGGLQGEGKPEIRY